MSENAKRPRTSGGIVVTAVFVVDLLIDLVLLGNNDSVLAYELLNLCDA